MYQNFDSYFTVLNENNSDSENESSSHGNIGSLKPVTEEEDEGRQMTNSLRTKNQQIERDGLIIGVENVENNQHLILIEEN